MDEVISHCLRELAFDGDFGCAVSRLRDFVVDFYSSQQSPQSQKLDDAFHAFIWSLVAQQPGVRVGKMPGSLHGDVFVAPDESTRKKGGVKQGDSTEAVELDIIEDAAVRPLSDLVAEHGDQLRIAVSHDRVLMALIGTHIRPGKLTAPVFTALQLVARGREAGISTVDLSNQTGYDAKACHYLVSKLLDLNLVEKRKKSGIGSHVIIHKYFFDRSPVWQKLIADEAEAAEGDLMKGDLEAEEEPDDEISTHANITFEPLDMRFVSSLPIVRARVVKLLLASPHHTHPAQNIMTRVGFHPKTRTERRFFMTRLRELMAQGLIEKVQVPHPRRKNAFVTCLRLLSVDVKIPEEEVEPTPTTEEDEDVLRFKGNEMLHRQMIDLIEASGTEGTTITALSQSLCDFDRRIVELLLQRLEQYPPPPHLADLGICQMAESVGRERRFKYFTTANFHILAHKEGMTSPYLNIDLSSVGDFLNMDDEEFYEEDQNLKAYVDQYVTKHIAPVPAATAKTPKAKKPPQVKPEKKPKTPRPPKHKNPLLPDGSVKKGRPRKYARGDGLDGDTAKRGAKRKRDEDDINADQAAEPTEAVSAESHGPGAQESAPPPAKKRRGRPPKAKPDMTPIAVQESVGPPGVQIQTESPESASQADVQDIAPPDEPTIQLPGSPTPATRRTRGKRARGDVDSSATSRRVSRRLAPKVSDEPVQPSEVVLVEPGPSRRVPTRAESSIIPETAAAGSSTTEAHPEGSRREITTRTRKPEIREDSHISATPRLAEQSENARAADVTGLQPAQSVSAMQLDPALLDNPELITMDPSDDQASTQDNTQLKRPAPSTSVTEYPSKRAKTSGSDEDRGTVNISHSRREKEFLQVISEAGGIINLSGKDFLDAHSALLERLVKAGEPVSSRVTARADKRTVDATLTTLENQGKIKIVATQVTIATGSTRRVRVVYLEGTPEDELASFLSELGRTIQPFAMATPLKVVNVPLQIRWSRDTQSKTPALRKPEVVVLDPNGSLESNTQQVQELFSRDQTVIRESLLTEKDTVAQLYGFISGKAARAKAMHILTAEMLQSQENHSGLVSKQDRIVHLSFFSHSIPIASYCSLVACLKYNEQLLAVLQAPEGRQTSLADLPEAVLRSLQLNRVRSQSRLLDLLDVLQALDLVAPLKPSSSGDPSIRVPTQGVHPTSFEPFVDTGAADSPEYWQFKTQASLFLWILRESPPRFWKDVPVTSASEAEAFWLDLESVSLDYKKAKSLAQRLPAVERALDLSSQMQKFLRRLRSWTTTYNFSWFQEAYLRRFIDVGAISTPLENGSDLEKLAWVTAAPVQAVKRFYEEERSKLLREAEKIRLKSEKEAEEKASLVQKAASAKQQREVIWDDMVKKVYPEPLKGSASVRVRRVRTKFMQSSGADLDKWEAEIKQAIEEAKVAAIKAITSGRPEVPAVATITSTAVPTTTTSAPAPAPTVAPPPLPPPVVRSVPEKSVETLIAQQGPQLAARTQLKKKKSEQQTSDSPSDILRRRHRFQWNREYDELARDASAIIKARCRNGVRLDWSALEQVFPAVPRNSVRQRIGTLRELAGGETYLKRLEDKWYELWVRHRGTETLPDPDPESASNFDIIAHVKFLRNHIDKTALRIGFVETVRTITAPLPSSVKGLEDWEIVEKPVTAPTWDFMWTVASEEAREKQFLYQALLTDMSELPPTRTHSLEDIHVAEAAVKMVLGVPNSMYDMDASTVFLKSVGDEVVATATQDLLERGVLSKIVRDPSKPRPGRPFKISEMNMNALGGSLSAELFQDASTYEESISQRDKPQAAQTEGEQPERETQDKDDGNEWREWPLVASDGNTAALIELISQNKVELKVDTSNMKFAHEGIDWNSKKIDDDDIETAILVRITSEAKPASPSPARIEATPDIITSNLISSSALADESHGSAIDGEPAACQKASSTGPFDCETCLQGSFEAIGAELSVDEFGVLSLLKSYLATVGAKGVTKAQLQAKFSAGDIALLPAVLARITEGPVPTAFWTGYKEVVLVSSAYLRAWTVTTKDGNGGIVRVFPRRWLDLDGRTVQSVWEAARKAVMGVIIFRPGVTQAEIRWRLRSVYDRQEIGEVLQRLCEEGYVKKQVEAHDDRWAGCGPPDDEEERMAFWTAGELQQWYTV